MKIEITIKCPCCSCKDIKKNGKKKNKKQNYLCNDCGRQFIGDHNLTYKGCCSSLINKIMLMFVRGTGDKRYCCNRKCKHRKSVVSFSNFKQKNNSEAILLR